MSRTSMDDLITQLRTLVNDPAGSSATWDDDQMQRFLDQYRFIYRQERLEEMPTVQAGGKQIVLEFYAPDGVGWWESDTYLQDSSWTTVTPATIDLLTGYWKFTTEPKWPIYITGNAYDLNGAAAECLENWVMKEKTRFNVSISGKSFSLQQKFTNMQESARMFRAKQRPRHSPLVRSDQIRDWDW